ncbi:MAG: hypothetical protein L7F77_09400 [Candidatus Magnetominusculus sp. LBB02]|nr:hypothetical protein [Candidatus Magnetominusculus sp. LBB02]
MNAKRIITSLLRLVILGLIIISTISCEEDVLMHFIYYKYRWLETRYDGPGHGNKAILDTNYDRFDNGSIYTITVSLDNFTKDAVDIRERFNDLRTASVHYWLTFNYVTFSNRCKEVSKDMTVFPVSISCPDWWPDDLKKSFFQRDRSRYKFYRCRASFGGAGLSFFQYFAIYNSTNKGYYWRTMLENTDEKRIRQCYYAWEDYK